MPVRIIASWYLQFCATSAIINKYGENYSCLSFPLFFIFLLKLDKHEVALLHLILDSKRFFSSPSLLPQVDRLLYYLASGPRLLIDAANYYHSLSRFDSKFKQDSVNLRDLFFIGFV